MPAAPEPRAPTGRDAVAEAHRHSRAKWIAAGALAGALLGAAARAARGTRRDLVAVLAGTRGDGRRSARDGVARAVGRRDCPDRAQALHGRGRVYEALAVLDTIPRRSARTRADELKTTIQRQLLGAGRGQGPKREGATRCP